MMDPVGTKAETQEGAENATPSGTEAATDAETVKLPDGQEVPVSEILRWRDAKPNLERGYRESYEQAAAEKKAAKEERAALAAERATLEAERRALNSPAPKGGLDEYVPGLEGRLSEIGGTLKDFIQEQRTARQTAMDRLSKEEAAEKMDDALDGLMEKPAAQLVRADRAAISSFMEEHGLPSEKVDVAFRALYGFQLGEMAKENAMRRRGAGAPAPMRGATVGIGGSTPQEVPAARKALKDTSFQEVSRQAMNDPRRPR